jgi:hypothetical protein
LAWAAGVLSNIKPFENFSWLKGGKTAQMQPIRFSIAAKGAQ